MTTTEIFTCPICSFAGAFVSRHFQSGYRQYAQCPQCRALERHRLQVLVVEEVFAGLDTGRLTALHVAPEASLRTVLSSRFGRYETADLFKSDVDHHVDLQNMAFDDASYDLVFASHVLEHISRDDLALREIRRILKPNGIAILPVPVVVEQTVEYAEANPHESFHVRAPGPDYFARYERVFSRVDVFRSESFPSRYQLFVYEDRTNWPTPECPLRTPTPGERHADFVPVCYV